MQSISQVTSESINDAIDRIPDGNRAEIRTLEGECLKVVWKPYPEELVRGTARKQTGTIRAAAFITTAISLIVVMAILTS